MPNDTDNDIDKAVDLIDEQLVRLLVESIGFKPADAFDLVQRAENAVNETANRTNDNVADMVVTAVLATAQWHKLCAIHGDSPYRD